MMVDWDELKAEAQQRDEEEKKRSEEWQRRLKLKDLQNSLWPSLDEHAEDPDDPFSGLKDSHAKEWASRIKAFVNELTEQGISDRIDDIKTKDDRAMEIAKEYFILARDGDSDQIAEQIRCLQHAIKDEDLCEAVRVAACTTIPNLLIDPDETEPVRGGEPVEDDEEHDEYLDLIVNRETQSISRRGNDYTDKAVSLLGSPNSWQAFLILYDHEGRVPPEEVWTKSTRYDGERSGLRQVMSRLRNELIPLGITVKKDDFALIDTADSAVTPK